MYECEIKLKKNTKTEVCLLSRMNVCYEYNIIILDRVHLVRTQGSTATTICNLVITTHLGILGVTPCCCQE